MDYLQTVRHNLQHPVLCHLLELHSSCDLLLLAAFYEFLRYELLLHGVLLLHDERLPQLLNEQPLLPPCGEPLKFQEKKMKEI